MSVGIVQAVREARAAEWVRATDPWGTVTDVRVDQIAAIGQREQDGQQFGLIWLRQSDFAFWCSLEEMRLAHARLGIAS